MNKVEHLSRITDLLHVGGLCEVALLSCKGEQSQVNYYIPEVAFLTNLTYYTNPFEIDVDLPLYDLGTLSRILSLMGKEEGDVEVGIGKKKENLNDTNPHSIRFKSGNIDTEFILGDRRIVNNEKVISKEKIPNNLEFDITEEIREQFFKYSNVLKGYDHFSINAKNNQLEINFGDILRSHENSITISLNIKAPPTFRETMFFRTDIFTNLLKINEKADITMRINKMAYALMVKDPSYQAIYLNASKKIH